MQERRSNNREMIGWRRTAASKADIKGKSRSPSSTPLSPYPLSSVASSLVSHSGHVAPIFAPGDIVEAEITKEQEGELDSIPIDDGGLSKQMVTSMFLVPEIV
jgi:hypothetical protein